MYSNKLILLLINPITLWLKWIIKKYWLEFKHRKQHLFIDYMVEISNCKFENYNTIYKHTRLLNCHLGSYTYVSKDCQIQYCNIGKFCSIAPGVKIGLGIHPTHFVSTHPIFFSTRKQAQVNWVKKSQFEEYKTTSIGNDVWIGTNAIIRDGVTIGDGAIIGAGAIVIRDIPPYAIVGGVPAKVIRYRFEQSEIQELLNTQWWNKEESWIIANINCFYDVKSFIESNASK